MSSPALTSLQGGQCNWVPIFCSCYRTPEKEKKSLLGENRFERKEIYPEPTELSDYSDIPPTHVWTLKGGAPSLPPGVRVLCIDTGLPQPSVWNPCSAELQTEACCPSADCDEWGRDVPEGGMGQVGAGRGRSNQQRKWSLINASATQKPGRGCPLFLYLWLCNVDLITALWTQQISSPRAVENIDVLFTKNFWEACCTYVSTTACLDGFYLIVFWKAYGEDFYCGTFNSEMCCAWRKELLGVTVLCICEVCWWRDVHLGSCFIVIFGACGWLVPWWRSRFVRRQGSVQVLFGRIFAQGFEFYNIFYDICSLEQYLQYVRFPLLQAPAITLKRYYIMYHIWPWKGQSVFGSPSLL